MLLVLLRRNVRLRDIAIFLGTCVTATVVWRFFLWNEYVRSGRVMEGFMRCYHGSDTRADALLVGCLTAVLVFWKGLPGPGNNVWKAVFLASWALVLCMSMFEDIRFALEAGVASPFLNFLFCGGFTVVALMAACIIVGIVAGSVDWVSGAMRAKWLRRLGVVSYGLYLWHGSGYGIADALTPVWRSSLVLWHVGNVVRVLLALLLAAISYRFIERRFLRMKERFQSS